MLEIRREVKDIRKDINSKDGKLVSLIREEIKTEFKLVAELPEKVTRCEERVEELEEATALNMEKIEDIDGKSEKLKHDNKALTERIAKLEGDLIANNVILSGINELRFEKSIQTRDLVVNTIASTIEKTTEEDKLAVARKMYITSCERIGIFNQFKPRDIRVKFQYIWDKELFLYRKFKLDKGIYAEPEFTPEVKRNRQTLRPILQRAKRLDSYKKCNLYDDTLKIDGKRYTVNNLHELPENLAPHLACERDNDDKGILGFFGELSHFSNFYKTEFNVNGEKFSSSEQFIQVTKSRLFKQDAIAKSMMRESDPKKIKELSRKIDNYDSHEWRRQAEKLCEPGILAKFRDNPALKKRIVESAPTRLVECSKDDFWGTGHPLSRETWWDEDDWTSTGGIMSQILHRVRDILSLEPDPLPIPMSLH